MKEMLSTHKELKRRIEAMERKYDSQFKVLFEALRKVYPVRDCELCTILM